MKGILIISLRFSLQKYFEILIVTDARNCSKKNRLKTVHFIPFSKNKDHFVIDLSK